MYKSLALIIAVACLYFGLLKGNPDLRLALDQLTAPAKPIRATSQSDRVLATAFERSQSDVQVIGQGTVTKLLPDDLDSSKHQRFILRLQSGQTLLIAHNIDLAPRIRALKPGDTVQFYGEYDWNAEGGVIHWTHRDPRRRHVAGWLKHQGLLYQ